MKKQKIFNLNFLEKTNFLDDIENILSIPLGPQGTSVLYANKMNQIKFLNNASQILQSLDFESNEERLLLKLFQHVSKKTQSICGDGSSSTSLLLTFSLAYSLKLLSNGHNSIILSKGLRKICSFCLSFLSNRSKPIKDELEMKALVRSIIGKKLPKDLIDFLENSIYQLKRDGLILVEENFSAENEMTYLQGIEMDKGFSSSYFVNDLKNFEVSYEKVLLLIATSPINGLEQIKDCLEYSKKTNQPLAIIVENISKELLSTLVLNSIKGKLKLVVIKYSSINFLKTALLEDLALLSHSFYENSINIKDKNIPKFYKAEHLGFLSKIVVKKDKSTFFISKFSKLLIERRINELNRELLSSETDYEKNVYKTRISRLSGNILKIKLGQSNQYETNEQLKNIENLVLALTSALEEGSIAGGGSFYLFLIPELKQWSQLNLIGDEIYSSHIMLEALSKLFEKLSSKEKKDFYQIKESLMTLGYPYTYDSIKKKIGNAFDLSLLDSSKTTRFIFSNSISILSTLITSE
jgi:chaperonin GroEL